jgi:ATP-binding protein involved in chromosome partitioning
LQLKVLSDGVAPAVGAAGGRVISMDLFLLDEATPVTWNHPGGQAADITVWRGTMEATVLREFLTDTAWGELDFLLLDLPPGSDRDRLAALFQHFELTEQAHDAEPLDYW